MESDLTKIKEADIFTTVENIGPTNVVNKEIYFYINKNSWCDGLKNVIKLALTENHIFLLLECDDDIHKKGEIQIIVFSSITDFEEHYTLIENCIGYKH